uniref:Apyrase n=1 Tax=Chromera velia CCMP2878 TaxID=1169474 RepID=A0A0G4HCH4_9ALVE|mmetsp:Transcript_27058/g.53098  ORF Transcript_27058/g.53098 Transcript_27058/m.53098 type:complete len:395 (+) Transcript_27058:159-1343(+)|eukprot:Cvel_6323.t1-p1 / transcript=Cvel_6323.t1 / gene=Cvel_6323 / organism=Chromera_velia_CCMP2878 / gene_product=Soluble calcium-activated nucleotidase 1, putative / transcript_product=Soluble calcium-activated nucleotidase 1, putative / location=Cvel_scaffold307:13361-17343(+) / protein_length=394 / sequence_SO=supercontig / SO=protein_coding / is_pseudo=false
MSSPHIAYSKLTKTPGASPVSIKQAVMEGKGRTVIIAICAAVAVMCFFFIFSSSRPRSDGFLSRRDPKMGSVRRTIPCTDTTPCKFYILADLDQQSKVPESKKPKFRSVIKPASIIHQRDGSWSIRWEDDEDVFGNHNEAGRGMELSELLQWHGMLLSGDDRTGIVYEHLPTGVVAPRFILAEGDGNTNKGMKIEWMTEKDGDLYVGSFGKEFTDATGEVVQSRNNMWVTVISPDGATKRVNWTREYDVMRETLGTPWPGYLIHEAVHWSEALRKWVILPRRVSKEKYDEDADEKRGSNKAIFCDESITRCEGVTMGQLVDPARGFSSFKFVPGTKDGVILALKSLEDGASGTQKSYLSVLSTAGDTLMEETEVPSGHKFEGLEFVDSWLHRIR